MTASPRSRLVLVFALCAVAGLAAVYLPWRFARTADPGRVASNMVDGLRLISLGYLVVIGAAAGAASPVKWKLWGIATVAFLPVLTFVDILRDSTSHNLWPFEMILYGLMSLPGLAGSFVASRFRARPPSVS